MNRIVKRHYPAAKLPADLREGLDPGAEVEVVVTVEEAMTVPYPTLEELFREARNSPRTRAEIDAELERQRDAWDGR